MTDTTTITNAADLDTLAAALNKLEREHGTSAAEALGGNFLATELPTFGGPDPEELNPGCSEGVFSWDATRFLLGDVGHPAGFIREDNPCWYVVPRWDVDE